MRVDVVSIFPEYLAPLELSLIGKARAAGVLDVAIHDLREHTHDRHRTVDDTPYGGGAGMVMRPEPWGEALAAVTAAGRAGGQSADAVPALVVPTPAGRPFTQRVAEDLAARPWLAFACGRYEGIDERVVDDAARRGPVLPLSLGDYVLGGGEVAVLVVVEAVARLLPGVLGNPESLTVESHADGLLEAPAYTRPARWRDLDAPAVLASGDHGRVERWRRDAALTRTARRRPDLIEALTASGLDRHDLALLAELGWATSDAGAMIRADTAGPGVLTPHAVADWPLVPPDSGVPPQGDPPHADPGRDASGTTASA